MPTLKIPLDFEGVEDFDTLPAGVYPAVVEKLTYRPAKKAEESPDGKAKVASISVEYSVTDPEFEGRKLWQNLYFSQGALFRMKAFFDAFGASADELKVDEETGLVLEPDLGGTAVEVKTFIDGYGGTDRNKIDAPPVVIGSAAKKVAAARKARAADADEVADDAPPRRLGGRAIR